MNLLISGITVMLYEKTLSGADEFGHEIYTEKPVEVPGVLVGEPSTDDIINEVNLSGKRLAYTLAIPKRDTHNWNNCKVSFWGQNFRTYGDITQGIEENIPLAWNKKVKVERYG